MNPDRPMPPSPSALAMRMRDSGLPAEALGARLASLPAAVQKLHRRVLGAIAESGRPPAAAALVANARALELDLAESLAALARAELLFLTPGEGGVLGGVPFSRRWRPAVTTGVLAAAPSTAAATGSALLAACGSCLGAGSAVAVSAAASATGGAAAGATTGAAASGGMPLWQIVFTVSVFAVLIGLQLRQALRAAGARGGSGGRAAFVLRQVAPGLLTAAVVFAAVQLVLVPWLAAPPLPAGPTLP